MVANTVEDAGIGASRIDGGRANAIANHGVTDSSRVLPGRGDIRAAWCDAAGSDNNVIQRSLVSDDRSLTLQAYGIHLRDVACHPTRIIDDEVSCALVGDVRSIARYTVDGPTGPILEPAACDLDYGSSSLTSVDRPSSCRGDL